MHLGGWPLATGSPSSAARFSGISCADRWTIYLSRELANHIGQDGRFRADADRRSFDAALATHCIEASRIVRDFAGGWYGKTVWRDGDLSREAAGRFAGALVQQVARGTGASRDCSLRA
jgi:hypothetical protein